MRETPHGLYGNLASVRAENKMIVFKKTDFNWNNHLVHENDKKTSVNWSLAIDFPRAVLSPEL